MKALRIIDDVVELAATGFVNGDIPNLDTINYL